MKLAAIVGPTAVGKTQIALEVAERLGGEILSCDSMQVYRGMDIGTAKASPQDRARVPHHLLDLVDPGVNYTVADYQQAARELIQQLNQRGVLPIMVGGTGLYYQAVVDNYHFLPMPGRREVRRRLEEEADLSLAALFERLRRVDPAAARVIKPGDRKRIIRALEVYEVTGLPFSSFQVRDRNAYRLAAVGLFTERRELYRRIEERVDKMIKDGLVEEVAGLYRRGYDLPLNSMQALGYRQVLHYLKGYTTLPETVAAIKKETRRYAKRQMTWFRKDDRIKWFNVAEYKETGYLVEKICDYISRTLENHVE